MTTPSAPLASVALPIAPSAAQPASTDGQQIDWANKIAEVMRDQFGLKPKQQNLTMMIQPKSPIEVLANRISHANGVTWVFHDLATGFVLHVNVPNVPPVAQQ